MAVPDMAESAVSPAHDALAGPSGVCVGVYAARLSYRTWRFS
jgi:hypothetical protein